MQEPFSQLLHHVLSFAFMYLVGLAILGQLRLSGALSPARCSTIVTRSRPYHDA